MTFWQWCKQPCDQPRGLFWLLWWAVILNVISDVAKWLA